MKRAALLAAVVAVAIIHVRSVSAQCSGDCNGTGFVTVDELVTGVAIALETRAVAACRAMDQDADQSVRVSELVSAVQRALHGCFATTTPTPSLTASAIPTSSTPSLTPSLVPTSLTPSATPTSLMLSPTPPLLTPSPTSTNPSALTVAISSPLAATVYTRGSVTLQVAVGGNPNTVQLLRDGSLLVELAPPYQYTWDTTSEDEGTYTIIARAIRGATQVDSDARVIVVDRTPPRVIERTPADGSASVWQRAPIAVRVSEPLLASSVTAQSVRIKDMDDVVPATTVALDAAGTTLTIASLPAVDVPNVMTGTVAPGMTDRAGNALSPSEWTWTLPEWIGIGAPFSFTEDGSAFLPTVRLDSHEQPIVAWMEFDASGLSAIHVIRWDESQSTWIPFERSPAATRAFFPAMVVDDEDRPVLAWSQQDTSLPPQSTIHVERWNGSGFDALGSDLSLDANAIEMPSIALDGRAVLVAWSEGSSGTEERNINIKRFVGSSWNDEGPPLSAVAGTGTHAVTPALITERNDTEIVAWSEHQVRVNNIYVANWNGLQWDPMGGALSVIPGPLTDALLPALVLQADGTPIVAWSETDGVTRSANVARWSSATNQWKPLPPRLSAISAARSDAFGVHLALYLDGNPIVVWSEGEFKLTGGYESAAIWVRRWTGTAWEPIGMTGRLKANPGVGNAADPSVVVDSHGSVIVAWDEKPESGHSTISVMRYNR